MEMNGFGAYVSSVSNVCSPHHVSLISSMFLCLFFYYYMSCIGLADILVPSLFLYCAIFLNLKVSFRKPTDAAQNFSLLFLKQLQVSDFL